MRKTKVLIVDDSGFARSILSKGLSLNPLIDVVGAVASASEAQHHIKKLKPDVLTLDVHMPQMNGIEFLQKIIPDNPIPVVMVSAYTEKSSQITIDALMAGAVDFVLKPLNGTYDNLSDMVTEIQQKVIAAAHVDVRKKLHQKARHMNGKITIDRKTELDDKVIVIGASTGGVDAITKIVTNLPTHCPGIVIVQHMPVEFTRMFASRLNTLTALQVSEAQDRAPVSPGKVYIARGDQHVEIQKLGSGYITRLLPGKPVNGHIPSVEVLFRSAARYARKHVVGVMLTGMGNDGAQAMLEMKNAGAKIIIQDKESSIVFGMPGEAYKLGAAESLTSLSKIPETICNYVKEFQNEKPAGWNRGN